MLVGLVRRDAAVRLGPVFAALVVTEPPEHVNIVHHGSTRLEVVVLLLVVAVGALLPLYADVVLVSRVLLALCLVRLPFVFALWSQAYRTYPSRVIAGPLDG